jgi:hypothetical protein
MAAFSERLAWLDRLEIGQQLSYAIRNTPSHASFFVADAESVKRRHLFAAVQPNACFKHILAERLYCGRSPR